MTNAAAAATDAELERQFTQTVRPFLATYCTGCHAGAKPQANLDLGQYSTVESVVRDYDHWTQVVEKLTAKAMPPKVAKQPSESSRRESSTGSTMSRRTKPRRTPAIRVVCLPGG